MSPVIYIVSISLIVSYISLFLYIVRLFGWIFSISCTIIVILLAFIYYYFYLILFNYYTLSIHIKRLNNNILFLDISNTLVKILLEIILSYFDKIWSYVVYDYNF